MIDVIDNTRAFERLRPEWTRLLQASAADCLFLTWEWLFTWWRYLAGNRRLFVLVVRSGEEVIAIAPFARSARKVASLLPVPAVEFLGTGTVGSDYLDIIVRRGAEDDALDALGAYLVYSGVVLDLAQLDATASASAELAGLLTANGWNRLRSKADVRPFIRLAGHTWETYLATLGSEHRSNFNRRLRQAKRNFEVRFEQAQSPEECRIALDGLIALHNMRWEGHGGSNAFHSPAVVRFHHAMTRLSLDRGWLRLFVLSFDGVPVAALCGFLYQNVFYFYQFGYDPGYRKHSVGLIAMGLAIKQAIEEGATQFDMLHGDESYKFHRAKELRELEHLEL